MQKYHRKYKGKISFPIAFDYEYESIAYAKQQGINPTNALIDSIARGFMDSLHGEGWFANLYTNNDFIRSGSFLPLQFKLMIYGLRIIVENLIIRVEFSKQAAKAL